MKYRVTLELTDGRWSSQWTTEPEAESLPESIALAELRWHEADGPNDASGRNVYRVNGVRAYEIS